MTKATFLLTALFFVAIGLLAGASYHRVFLSIDSPDEALVVSFSDTPFALTPDTKNTYLSIGKDGKAVVDRKLIYSGDVLDAEFSELYPKWKWIDESVFGVGSFSGEPSDRLTIENSTESVVDYLLAETYGNKLVIIGLQPGQKKEIGFIYREKLSIEGESFNGASRFADALEAKRGPRPFRFKALVGRNGVLLTLENGEAERTKCCGADRPGW